MQALARQSRSAARFRHLSIFLSAAALTGPAFAGDPPSAAYPKLFSFGQGKGLWSDVAPYAPNDAATYVFAADNRNRSVVRYLHSGTSNIANRAWSMGQWGHHNPIGIAANDRPGSPTFGRVIASDFNGLGVLWHLNTDLMVLGISTLWITGSTPLIRPADVAFDERGDVYVADSITNVVCRFAAADIAALNPNLTAVQFYGDAMQSPTGVSVDHNGRVHVTYENGDYRVFGVDGASVSYVSLGNSSLQGMCALNPCADGFTTRFEPSTARYELRRVDWDWMDMDGAFDLAIGGNVLRRPSQVEFQKHHFSLGGVVVGWTPQRCTERTYVSGPDRVNVFGQSYDSVPVPAERRAWFRFEEAQNMSQGATPLPVDDYLGTNDAAPGPVLPRNVEGMVRCAADTRGGTAFAVAPDSAELDFGSGSMAIEGWLRSEQRSGTVTVLDKRVGLGAGYSVYLWNGRIGVQLNTGQSYQNFHSPTVIADGRWRHFAIVLERADPSTVTLYVDGEQHGQYVAQEGNIDSYGPLYIGCPNPGAVGFPLVGALDELTLYGEPLTPSQVAAIADARSAGKHLWSAPSE